MHGTQIELSISDWIDKKNTSKNNHWWQYSIKLQKEVKPNPKTAQLYKKCVAPKKAIVKKDVKSKVAAKKWLWW